MSSFKDDEDDSLNGGERSRVIKGENTETFVELPTNGEKTASRNLDDREVEDDWDGTYSDNGDYVEGRINKTFVAQPSKGEQASSRNSNQSINRQENDHSTLERWISIILIFTHQIYISIQHQQKSHISQEESFFHQFARAY